ncbi:hypothetical protein [Mesorhizobium sp. M0130]|uniref:hypothetical protein n=1 Tax=Mesorhizobium sp. M0130 TaxID=2956887 RepID=UPI00333661D9
MNGREPDPDRSQLSAGVAPSEPPEKRQKSVMKLQKPSLINLPSHPNSVMLFKAASHSAIEMIPEVLLLIRH